MVKRLQLQFAEVHDHEVGLLARLDRTDLVLAAQRPRTGERRRLEGGGGVERAGIAGDRLGQQRGLAGFLEHVEVVVRGATVGADGHVGTGAAQGLDRAEAGRQLEVGLRAVRDVHAALPEADDAGRALVEQVQRWESETGPRLAPVMARRLASGRVREGHGDLHLGNVARTGSGCLVFDCIEFADDFRWLDVISEVAFLAMDLQAHGLPALAHRFVDTYLQHCGDYDGVRVLDYYLVHRALVRAKVALLRAAQADGNAREQALAAARRYLDVAQRTTLPRPHALLITHGLSGSGKTSLTQGLLEAEGAVRIRADVERKRLAGLDALDRAGAAAGSLYTAAMSEATYARLLDAATSVLEGGWTAIVDATFLRGADRRAAYARAAVLGVPFAVLHFDAPAQVLRERLKRRAALGADASDADAAVLAAQQQAQEPLAPDEMPWVHVVQALPETAGATPIADWTALRRWLRSATVATGVAPAAHPVPQAPGGPRGC